MGVLEVCNIGSVLNLPSQLAGSGIKFGHQDFLRVAVMGKGT